MASRLGKAENGTIRPKRTRRNQNLTQETQESQRNFPTGQEPAPVRQYPHEPDTLEQSIEKMLGEAEETARTPNKEYSDEDHSDNKNWIPETKPIQDRAATSNPTTEVEVGE